MKNPVVCRALEPLIVHIKANSDVKVEDLLLGVQSSFSTLSDPSERIPWSDFAKFVENVENAVGGREKFAEMVAETGLGGDSPVLSVIRYAKFLTDPIVMYDIFQRFGGPAMFPCVQSSFEKQENRVIRATIITPENDIPCPQFFSVTKQMITELPTIIGSSPALVFLEQVDEYKAYLTITVPPSVSLWARMRRMVSVLFSTEWFEEEISLQNNLMLSAFDELKTTNAVLAEKTLQLETSQKRFTLAVSGARDGIWDWDLNSDEIYFSKRWYEISGYDPSYHVLDRLSDWLERVHAIDKERVRQSIDDHVDGKTDRLDIQYRIVLPNREERTVHCRGAAIRDSEGNAERMAGSLSDITQLVETIDTLDATEKSYRAIIENSPDSTVMYTEEGIIAINKSMEKLMGYEENELVGKPILKISDSHNLFYPPEIVNLIGATEIEFLHKNGSKVHGEVSAIRVMFEGGYSYCAMIRDVTEKREMIQRAKEMDRMIAVGTMASGVAHEINNPMAYIHSNTEFAQKAIKELTKRIEDGEMVGGDEIQLVLDDVGAAMSDAIQGTVRVRDIVRDLKSYSYSAEREKATAVEVIPIIESAISMAAHETKARCKVETLFQRTPLVAFNETRLSQIILNLIVNAAHAISPGSPETNFVKITTHCNATNVFVEISDTGSGIPEQLRNKIFDPFFTTKPAGQGTGLGLSICYNIVRRFGGQLEFESEIGKGTTFKVTLPRYEESVAWDVAEKELSETLPDHHVLVIDDDAKIGVMMKRVLSADYHVTFVEDSTRALDVLDDLGDVDLIISDAMMPIISGYDILDQLEATRPDYLRKFILMTGGRLETARFEKFNDTYGVPVIFKPFDIEKLKSQISRHLEQSGPSETRQLG